ncbi:MAG: hypothetical protein QOI11_3984 [Candidatus Eremiobacteraeota bacterium]|nr:hypothetical protein [Candidatus Eremiobacteraeota bacterium]
MRSRSTSCGSVRTALVVLLILSGVVFQRPASAQQTPSAAQRQAQINRVIDGLNSPDPAARLATLEQAVGGKDANLRRVALSTAFASSDGVLRSAALSAAVGSASSLVVEMSPSGQSQEGGALRATAGNLEFRIVRFDRTTNTFATSSRFAVDVFGNSGNAHASQGSVSGDRISFSVALTQVKYECSGVARLQGSGTTMKGTMSCTYVLYTPPPPSENYAITIDALR